MPRFLLIAGLILMPLPTVAAGARELASAHASARKATHWLLAGDAERAERGYRKAVAAVPDFPEARLGLGHIALARDLPRAALEEYVAARRGYEQLGRALIDVERQRYDETRKTIAALRNETEELERRLEGKDTSDPRAHELQARLRGKAGQILQLEIVAPLAPDGDGAALPAEVHYHLGNALFRLEDVEGAVEAWSACAALRPDFAPVHGNLAVALMQLRRFADARASLDTAERLGMTVDARLKARLEALDGAGR